ncbi:MAG: hypothetical protein ABIB79_04025 [archaeon]
MKQPNRIEKILYGGKIRRSIFMSPIYLIASAHAYFRGYDKQNVDIFRRLDMIL